jgi:phosphoglycolate phosphatase
MRSAPQPSAQWGEGGRPWPRAVIFDLDGTLADTLHDLAAALNRTLAELDLPPHAPDAVRGMVGGGLGKLLDRGLDAGRQRAGERLVELYAAEPAAQSRLYPGAADALAALRQAGVPLGLCTNKPEPIARDLLQALGIAEAFGCIQGSDAGLPRKPDPAGATHVAARLGAAPGRTIMVGDSLTDVKTARAAGLAGIVLVSYGYSATPAQTLGADAVIDHLDELPHALALLASRHKHEA